jgi:hypothetical protein
MQRSSLKWLKMRAKEDYFPHVCRGKRTINYLRIVLEISGGRKDLLDGDNIVHLAEDFILNELGERLKEYNLRMTARKRRGIKKCVLNLRGYDSKSLVELYEEIKNTKQPNVI